MLVKEGEFSLLSLTFTDPQAEKAFTDSHREQLAAALKWMFLVAFSIYLLIIVALDSVRDISRCDTEPDWPHPDTCRLLWLQLAYQASFGGQLLVCSLVAHILARTGVMQTWVMEAIVSTSMCVFLCGTPMFYKHYLSRAYGYWDTTYIWGGAEPTDGHLLLYIDVCLTSMHLMVPIRWKFLVPMQLLSVVAFAVPAIFIESATPWLIPSNLIALCALVLMASYGKRAFEINDRKFFLTVLNEKKLRFHAEFQLAQVDRTPTCVDDVEVGSADLRSEGQSLPHTTVTGRMFDTENGAFSFEALVNLGQQEHWSVKVEDVRLLPGKALGEGGYGVVARGTYQGVEVAIKAAKQGIGPDSQVAMQDLCNELRILRHVRHPNIVFLYGAVLSSAADSVRVYLVLEKLRGMTLADFVPSCGDGEWAFRAQILVDVATAICYLHAKRPVVVHGDLKDTNVFVQQGACGARQGKLLDFGLSRQRTRSARPLGGTLRWMAPEVIRGGAFPDTPSDVFSFGRLMFFVSTGEKPFARKNGRALRKPVLRADDVQWPQTTDRDLAFFCKPWAQRCTNKSPPIRPLITDVLGGMDAISKAFPVPDAAEAGEQPDPPTVNLSPQQLEAFRIFNFARPEGHVENALPGMAELISQTSSTSSRLTALPETVAVTIPLPTQFAPAAAQAAEAPAGLVEAAPLVAEEEQAERLVYSSFEATGRDTMLATAFYLLTQWNHVMPSSSCCAFHAGVSVLEATCQDLAGLRCRGRLEAHGQCPDCGLLLLEDEPTRCDFCSADAAQ